jgi:hypothetical protein
MRKFTYLIIVYLFIFTGLNAQSTANYAFSTVATGSLTSMSGGTAILGPVTTGSVMNNVASAVTTIPFPFYYMGTAYTQFSVNSNGQMRLGATVIGGAAQTVAASTALLVPVSGVNTLEAAGAATYLVTGTSPNRILTVDWSNLRIPASATATTTTLSEMQVRLHEGTGVIEYVYGAMYNFTNATSKSVFLSSGTAATTVGSLSAFTTTPVYNTNGSVYIVSLAVGNVPLLNSSANGSRRIFTFTPPASPAAPTWATTPVTLVTGNGMTLNWNDNATTEAGYQISNSTDNVTYTPVATTAANATSYTATGLTDVTTYYWKVAAFNEGTAPTTTSVISQATPLAAPTWTATPITLPTTTGMTLNWIDNSSNETGYQVYNSTDNVTFNLVTTTPANTTTYAATGLSVFTLYYWKIAAVNGATTSAFTTVSSLSTLDNTPAAPTWAVTPITNPTTAGMTLNWVSNSTNQTGFEIYRSTDNITFTKIATTASNATSYAATGLSISTLYYWKVDAVNSGGPSAQTTASSLSTTATSTVTSVATGNWSSGSTWSSGGVPALTDDVVISTGNTVTIDAAANTAKTLTVNGSLTYNATTASTLTVNGNVTVAAGGSFTSPASGTVLTHALNIGGSLNTGVGGNLLVNGAFDMNAFSTAGVVVTFFGTSANTISGTGTPLNFYSIIVNKGASTGSVLDVQSVITCADATSTAGLKLSILNGAFKLSSASTLNSFYGSVQPTAAVSGRIWMNNAAAIIRGVGAGTVGGATGTLSIGGMLQIDAGTFAWGNGTGVISCFGNLMVNGPAAILNVYGSLWSGSGSTFTMTAGNINIYGQVGVNSAPTQYFSQTALFQYSGTSLTFSGGTLTIVDPTTTITSGLNYAPYAFNSTGAANYTGCIIQFGDGVSDLDGSVNGFAVSSGVALGNVVLNSLPTSVKSTRFVKLLGNLAISGNLTINGGTANQLQLGTYALTLGGNLSNAGSVTSSNVSTNILTLNGGTKQTISNTGTFLSNIPTLTINNTSGVLPAVDFQTPLTVSTVLNLTNGQLASSNASVLTLGNSVSSTTLTMIRNGGSLGSLPAFALTGVTYNVSYNAPAVAASTTTGFELPATGTATFTVNNPGGVILDKPVSCTTLALTSGILTTGALTTLTVTGTLPANVNGGSSTAYVNGPLALTIPNTATAANYKFPVGKTTSHLFEFSSITTGGTGTAVFTAEAFDAGPFTATAGTGLSAINTDKYWTLTGTLGTVTVASSAVRLTDAGLLSINRVGQSNMVTGTYNTVGGVVTGGTTIASATAIDYSAIAAGTDFRIGAATGIAAGTYAVGPSTYTGYAGTYPTVKAAITAITGVPLSGNMIFEIQADYLPAAETYPIALTPGIISSATAKVTFRPAAGVSSVINFTGTTSILTNTGADYILFDGRNGGTGTNQYFQFTSTSATAPTVLLSGDAQYNSFIYSTLTGSTTAASTGILTLNTPTLGNNFLKVDHCNFDAAGTANNCIFTTGLATNDTITNSNFHDYRNGAGINLASGSDNAEIDGNSFYQTTAYTGLAGTTSGIIVTGGINVRISNNSIGGNAPSLAGIWTVSATTPAAYNFTGINATALTTTSKIYNNKIQNFDWKTTTSTFNGLLVSGTPNVGSDGANYVGDNTTTGSITITGYTASGTITFNGISTSGAANTYVENNIIGSVKTAANGAIAVNTTLYPVYSSGSQIIRNNSIGSTTMAQSVNATTTGTNLVSGIYCTGTANSITGNTVANIYSASTGTTSTMRGISNASTGNLAGNTVIHLTSLGASAATSTSAGLIGILSGGGTISGNTIYDLANTSPAAVVVYGILYYGTDGGTSSVIEKNLVHSILTSSNTAVQAGINLTYGTALIKNNIIRLGIDKDGNSVTSTAQITGLSVAPTVGCCVAPQVEDIYFNTVYIGGNSVVAGTVKTYAFNLVNHSNYGGSGNGEDIRNNIFVNMRTNAVANALNYAVTLPAPMTTVPHTNDYNIYNVSATDGKLAVVNAVDQLTLKALQDSYSRASNLHSGFGDPLLVNPTGTFATLDVHPAALTEAEGTGNAVSIVTDDFTGAARSSNTPTDIGAYSGNYTLAPVTQDIFSPVISYILMGNGSSIISRMTATNFAAITDNVNGINITTGTLPRFYYKLPANANAFVGNTSADNGWKYVEATGTTSPFSFTLDYSLLYGGPVTVGSTIQYFVVAQNQATIPAVTFNPSTGASGTSVAAVVTAPTTPNSYTIVPSFPSAVTVGTGQTYTTLTGAGGLFASINAGTITANTVATITSDITEPGTTSLNLVNEEGTNAGALTVTVKSDGLANHVISGTAVTGGAPMISVAGARRFSIDGGAAKMLTFRNTNVAPSSTGAVIQFNGNSQNDTIRNCFIESNSTNANNGAITIGTGTNIVTIKGNDIRDARGGTVGSPTTGIYSNTVTNAVTITGNNIYNQININSYGLYLVSVASGCTITGNSFYCESPKIAAGAYTGIYLTNTNNHMISGNYIGGSAPLCAGSVPFTISGFVAFTGIYLSNPTGIPTTVQGNTIQNITMTNTIGPVFNGINNVSYGSVNIVGNVIGSITTANSVQIAGTGASAGINQTYNYVLYPCKLDSNTIANITLTNALGAPTFYGMKTYSNLVRKNTIYNIGTSANIGVNIYGIYNSFNNGNTFTNEISNNVISLNGGASTTATIYGFQETSIFGSTGFYYNSININGTATGGTTYAFQRSAAGTYTFNNNILVNTRSGGTSTNYAIYSVPSTLFTSNYNDFYVAGTTLGHVATTDYATLAAWKTGTLGDANSISADPLFTSPTAAVPDLTLQTSSPAIGAGKPVTGITTDAIGTVRNVTTPTLGAYEFYAGIRSLNLSNVMLEGLYSGAGVMRQAQDGLGNHWPVGVADHITVELHSAVPGSYATIIYAATDVPLSTTGAAMVVIPALYNGSYFITVKHRNSLQTVSATAVPFAGSTINQSFALPANVYGGNLVQMTDLHYTIYGGDVNQDGIIDGGDFAPVDNLVSLFSTGYLPQDVNGDGLIDGSDFAIIDNNVSSFVSSVTPP